MSDSAVSFESIPWRRVLPWLHLTRAFWIAVDLRKLVLAAAGLLLISAGSLVFDQLPFANPAALSPETLTEHGRWPWQWSLGYTLPASASALEAGREALQRPVPTVFDIAGNWRIVLHPIRTTIEPAVTLFRGNVSLSALADAVTRLLWALAVWSVFGGAIGRIAAVQFARDQQIGIGGALAFSLKRFIGYVSAPVLPLVGVSLLWGLCVIGGWLGRIPGGVGDVILGALWGLELIFGLMMAVVLLGLAAGWPLMFATIGVEGTDGFDGLSRTYNYVFERPLYYLWQVLIALTYGSAAIFFVWMIVQWLVHLAIWGVSWGLGYEATVSLVGASPAVVFGESFPGTKPADSFGADIARGWMCALATLVMGFVYSYFWTATTIIYFTLRRSVDANDFDEVFTEQDHEPDELLPLVGAAGMGAADQIASPEPAGPAPVEAPPVDLTP